MDVWCCCLLFCVSRPPARGLLLWIPGAGEAGLRRAVCAKIPFAMITIDSPLERVNYPDRITGGSTRWVQTRTLVRDRQIRQYRHHVAMRTPCTPAER